MVKDESLAKVYMPLPLAYSVDCKIVVLPYFSVELTENILGVVIEDIVVGLEQIKDSFYRLDWIKDEYFIKNKKPHLPKRENMEALIAIEDDFNETIDILQKNGVKSDFLDEDGRYWLEDRYSSSEGFVYSVKERDCFVESKDYNNYIRLFWKLSIRKQQPSKRNKLQAKR